jgi:hypothetical protein
METQAQDDALEEANPLLVWVAYTEGEGSKRNYLSNGKGGLRVFKSEDKLNDYLKETFDEAMRAKIKTHSIQGKIAIPIDDYVFASTDYTETIMPAPIHTLAVPTAPTATEQLDMILKRRRIRRK